MRLETKITILEMIKYSLMMLIFTAILISGALFREDYVVEHREKASVTIEDVKRIQNKDRMQYYADQKKDGVEFEGDAVVIKGVMNE